MVSLLRFIPKSSAAAPINWSKIPEKSKQYFVQITAQGEDTKRSLPQNIGGLAESFHERNFFGYMNPELCQLLLDISEFGLKKEKPYVHALHGLPVGPRFYMKCGSKMWFLLFAPEDKGGVYGYNAKLPNLDDDEDAEAKKDKELAEIFDEKLVDEVGRISILNIFLSKRLAGWEAHTLESTLEQVRFAKHWKALWLSSRVP